MLSSDPREKQFNGKASHVILRNWPWDGTFGLISETTVFLSPPLDHYYPAPLSREEMPAPNSLLLQLKP